MPIIDFPPAPPKTEGKAAEQRIPMILCTLSDKDSGPACPACGYAMGAGHGRTK